MYQARRTLAKTAQAPAFTLIEVMVVVAVIALLLALLIPGFSQAREQALAGKCASNLGQLSRALLQPGSDSGPGSLLPSSDTWLQRAVRNGGKPVLICPKDDTRAEEITSLEDVYITQHTHTNQIVFTYLLDILERGDTSSDEQMSYYYQGKQVIKSQTTAVMQSWVLPSLGVTSLSQLPDNVAVIVIEHSALLKVEMGPMVTCTAYPRSGVGTGSRHRLCKGPGKDWEAEAVLTMGGKDTSATDPIGTYTFPGAEVSYGMNSLVKGNRILPAQGLLVDYEKSIVQLGGNNQDDFVQWMPGYPAAELPARHLGKANLLRVDGGVYRHRPLDIGPSAAIWQPVP